MRLDWKSGNITSSVTGITWSGSARQAARTVEFSVAYSPNDKNVEILEIEVGDKITFYPGYPDDKKTKFTGTVTTRERRSEAGELTYTATDNMKHFLRSSGTYKFKKKTPEKIAAMICKDISIPAGDIAKTKVNIPKMFFQERTYYEIIMAAYTKAFRKTKKPYIAQMNGSKLDIVEKGKMIPGFYIRQGENITDSSYSETSDNMVNRVYIYNSDNKKIGTVSNAGWAKKYGVFQNAISVDSGSGKTEAGNELHGIDKTANVTALGDYRCVSGKGVIIKDSRTGLNGKFWIENDSHEWRDGAYTMSLELAFKNVMDIQEEDEEQTTSSGGANGSGTSDALNDVLNQARAWLGVGEDPPGSNHNVITEYYGSNDQWCCMFIWAIFNKSGHGDLFMNGGKTAYCFSVSDWYKARGKFSSTPKVGSLVVYGGSGHIGIVESVNGNSWVSIEGNLSNSVKRSNGPSCSTVLGFCHPDYPVSIQTGTNDASSATITGKTVEIPLTVAQTGICPNYTSYPQFYGRWRYMQKTVSELWGQQGKPGKNKIATIDGYYLVALADIFGSVGDVVQIVLENGARINAIMADSKNPGDSNCRTYGHDMGGGKVDVVEWESMGGYPDVSAWKGQKVKCITNGGRYSKL